MRLMLLIEMSRIATSVNVLRKKLGPLSNTYFEKIDIHLKKLENSNQEYLMVYWLII